MKTTKGSVSSSHSASTPDDIFSSSLTRSLEPTAAALTGSMKEGDIFASGTHTKSGEDRKGRKKTKKEGAVAGAVSEDVDGKVHPLTSFYSRQLWDCLEQTQV